MSKLSNLHKWLTLDKSAYYLSSMLDEPVLITDLYRLALDKKLTLSIRFWDLVPVLPGKLISDDDYWSHSDSCTPMDTLTSSEPVDDDTWFIYEDAALNIQGVFDLSMLGLESIDIEKKYLYELGGFSYDPKRYNEQGVFLCRDDEACKILVKLEPSPVYEDKEFVNSITKNFLETKEIFFDECIDHNYDYETLAPRLTPPDRENLESIIDLMSISLPTDKIYKNCLTIEDYNHQLIIRKQELDRIIQLLKGAQQEFNPPAQDRSVKNSHKKIYNKAKTQDRYLGWQKQATKLKKKHPNKTKSWIAAEIAKLPMAEGKSAETIRKNINI